MANLAPSYVSVHSLKHVENRKIYQVSHWVILAACRFHKVPSPNCLLHQKMVYGILSTNWDLEDRDLARPSLVQARVCDG
ncbi:hypothetical protein TrispH2_007935 [Trichoplax sp. H2]|nr:hypothetical protein TrispH2_007935 [Trichoplax sp. H2]|eukprot:RDD39538.1 hypothetical protein TrispH2_007935 [Trichoplax sp. H2]